jgi:hypothetical protein
MFQGHICNIAGSRGISAISGFVRGIFAKTPKKKPCVVRRSPASVKWNRCKIHDAWQKGYHTYLNIGSTTPAT